MEAMEEMGMIVVGTSYVLVLYSKVHVKANAYTLTLFNHVSRVFLFYRLCD